MEALTLVLSVNCLQNQCSPLSAAAVGQSCTSTIQCPGSSQCTNSICGGSGGFCSSSVDCASGEYSLYHSLPNRSAHIACMAIGSCVSNTCRAVASPVVKKRDFEVSENSRDNPCFGSQIACPIAPKGYEVSAVVFSTDWYLNLALSGIYLAVH
jgi:hypothetical protein